MANSKYFRTRDGAEVDEREALDRNSCLKDGHSLRVPLMMRDSLSPLQRAVRDATKRDGHQHFRDGRQLWDSGQLVVTDAYMTGTSGNRPGWRILDTTDGQVEKARTYREHERWLNDAWRGDPVTGFGEQGMHGSREGDPCTRNGWAGTLRRGPHGSLFCDIGRHDAAPDEDWDGDKPDERVFDPANDLRTVTVDEMNAAHQRNMAKIYDAYARELSEAWKGGIK